MQKILPPRKLSPVSKSMRLWLLITLLAGLAAAAPLPPAAAAIFTVNTTVDALDGSCSDGDCSLRDAIALASTGDEIIIPSGTYTLAMGHLFIDKDLTLTGAGADTTIVQAASEPNRAASIVFFIFKLMPPAGPVVISGLTIRHGVLSGMLPLPIFGGGVSNYNQNVTLRNCTVAYNAFNSIALGAGGIGNAAGTMDIINCEIYGNTSLLVGSGGILNEDIMTITNSTISGNQISFPIPGAGGILNDGTLTINNCTIAANVGGGIINGGTITLTNSTISGNHSSFTAGGIYNGGPLTINNCTITANESLLGAGGVHAFAGTTTVSNSIIAQNHSSLPVPPHLMTAMAPSSPAATTS